MLAAHCILNATKTMLAFSERPAEVSMRIIAVSVGLAMAFAAPALADECASEATHFMQQDVDTFDQSAEGWRSLAHRGCYAEAADLISA